MKLLLLINIIYIVILCLICWCPICLTKTCYLGSIITLIPENNEAHNSFTQIRCPTDEYQCIRVEANYTTLKLKGMGYDTVVCWPLSTCTDWTDFDVTTSMLKNNVISREYISTSQTIVLTYNIATPQVHCF